MRDAMVKLGELGDPMAFLIGARVPLTLAAPMATWQRYEWISDRLLVRLCSDGAWVELVTPDWRFYCIDLSDPDVARWCDRKIGKTLGFVNPDHGVLGCTNKWCFWWVGDECPWFLADWRPELSRALSAIPCADANIPLARAAILRALFGVTT